MTGLSVAEDFGTFSSPVVLTSAASVGVVYNACITYGHKRDRGLPIDAGWPPVVIGLDDSYLNDPEKEREIKEDILFECFQKAQGEKVEEGNVGIGRGLCAFGLKVGIGQSSRKVQGYTVGILVASNGGIRRSLTSCPNLFPRSLSSVRLSAILSVRGIHRWKPMLQMKEKMTSDSTVYTWAYEKRPNP